MFSLSYENSIFECSLSVQNDQFFKAFIGRFLQMSNRRLEDVSKM